MTLASRSVLASTAAPWIAPVRNGKNLPVEVRYLGAGLFEEHGFGDIAIRKHSDPVLMVEAYRQLAAKTDYPLHLGVTEAGPSSWAPSSAFGALLSRALAIPSASLSADPVEIKAGDQILQSLNLRPRKLEIVSARLVAVPRWTFISSPRKLPLLRVWSSRCAWLLRGCVVNGPGEARDVDLGVASATAGGQIFVKGKVRVATNLSPRLWKPSSRKLCALFTRKAWRPSRVPRLRSA